MYFIQRRWWLNVVYISMLGVPEVCLLSSLSNPLEDCTWPMTLEISVLARWGKARLKHSPFYACFCVQGTCLCEECSGPIPWALPRMGEQMFIRGKCCARCCQVPPIQVVSHYCQWQWPWAPWKRVSSESTAMQVMQPFWAGKRWSRAGPVATLATGSWSPKVRPCSLTQRSSLLHQLRSK